MTNVDYCETHAEEAFLVNGQGTGNLAAAAHALGAKLVYYSTDYVFDGTGAGAYHEQDAPNPLSVYGKSKLRGEEFVRSACPDHLILRTSWLFGCHGKNFIRTIVDAARERRALRVVDDQRGSPTYTRDLAARTLALLEKEQPRHLSCDQQRIVHLVRAGPASFGVGRRRGCQPSSRSRPMHFHARRPGLPARFFAIPE